MKRCCAPEMRLWFQRDARASPAATPPVSSSYRRYKKKKIGESRPNRSVVDKLAIFSTHCCFSISMWGCWSYLNLMHFFDLSPFNPVYLVYKCFWIKQQQNEAGLWARLHYKLLFHQVFKNSCFKYLLIYFFRATSVSTRGGR